MDTKLLNIIELMENNPLTKLSGNYNSKFINKIKDSFNEMEQQMFVSSFFCYLNYHPTNDFVVDLDDAWKWLGFSQKSIAKRSLEKYFIMDKDYKISLYRSAEQTDDSHGGQNKEIMDKNYKQLISRGGQNKETILLNIKTFKRFCIKAETKKANEIHDYFIKMEEILHDLFQEESNELKEQLVRIKDIEINFDETLKREKLLQKETILLNQYGNTGCSVVYFIRVKTFENGKYIIKIGESQKGVLGRYKEHKKNYEECLLLDCVSVLKSVDFERYIHSHPKIAPCRYKTLPEHEKENELFIIGDKITFNAIKQIVNENLKKYNEYTKADFDLSQMKIEKLEITVEKLEITVEKLEAEKALLRQHLKEQKLYKEEIIEQPTPPTPLSPTPLSPPSLSPLLSELTNEIVIPENRIIMDKLNQLEEQTKELINTIKAGKPSNITTITGEIKKTVGPRLLQINPETNQIIKIFETLSQSMKESNFQNKRPSIEKAIAENIIYNGYRWLYAERDEDPENVVTARLLPSKVTKINNLGFVAKLNKEKTAILNVYLDRKTASNMNGFPSSASLDYSVKHGTIANNNYYEIFDKCSEELRTKFITEHEEPLLYKSGVGRFNKEDKIVETFICKYDCIKKMKIGDKKMEKLLDKNETYNDHFFKSIGSKLSVV
jgi:hypothetical protein